MERLAAHMVNTEKSRMKLHIIALCCLFMTHLCIIGATVGEESEVQFRQLTDEEVTKGSFDADTFSSLSKQHKHSNRNGGFSISLSLPDNDYAFTCKETSASSTSFFVCTDEQDERRSLREKNGTKSPPTKAFIGMNGSFFSGLVESSSSRCEIKTHINRDEIGDMTDVSYTYACAKPKDVFYNHVGIPSMEKEARRELEQEEDPSVNRKYMEKKYPLDEKKHITRNVSKIDGKIEDLRDTLKRNLIDDGSEIDLLIYFTKRGACQWIDEDYPCNMNTAAMNLLETNVETWIQYSNDVLTRSQISGLKFIKAHIAIDPDYDEGEDPSVSTAFYDITNMNDGKLDNAHTLRDEYYADLVVGFMYYPPSCSSCVTASGKAWVPSRFPDRTEGFSMTGGNYPFLSSTGLHEVGHNLGCNHHRSDYDDDELNEDEVGYGYGWADCSRCWVTIMSYSEVCEDVCDDVDGIDYFSNPNVNYNGRPTGTENDNNARVISQTKLGASMNRYRGQRMLINNDADSYKWGEIFVFQVKAKTDLTINNYEINTGDVGESARVQLSYARTPFNADNAFDDSLWTVAGDETIIPLSDIFPSFGRDFGIFSSPLGINVADSEVISIRIKMYGDSDFRVQSLSSTGLSVGDVALKNNDLKVYAGQRGDFEDCEDLSSSPVAMYDAIVYSVGSDETDDSLQCGNNEDKVTITVKTDNKGEEIYWFLKQFRATTGRFFNAQKSGKSKYGDGTLYKEEYCVKQNKCYRFVIKDTTSTDGLCCNFGEGYWRIDLNDVKLKMKKMIDVKKQTFEFGAC